MSRRASVVAASSRRGSVMSTSFGAGQIDDDEITNQEIVEKLLSKEEQRKLERDRLIKQLENEDDSEQVDEEEEGKKSDSIQMRKCPYLDTINRAVLDFDFEKLCSVSLTHMNIYWQGSTLCRLRSDWICKIDSKYRSHFKLSDNGQILSGPWQGHPCSYARARKRMPRLSEFAHGQVLLFARQLWRVRPVTRRYTLSAESGVHTRRNCRTFKAAQWWREAGAKGGGGRVKGQRSNVNWFLYLLLSTGPVSLDWTISNTTITSMS